MLPISIIVLVYNDEKNIPRCLDSILAQTTSNFECLVINDGSTDNCPQIIDEYAQKDDRLKVFHKCNEGISKSRQFGIIHAKGKYTFFIDSDDWIEASFLADISKKLENDNTDIFFMDFFEENASGNEKYNHQNLPAIDTETVIRHVLEGKLYSCLWNVVINRELYTINNINFTESINYGEDSLFIIELLLNNPKICYLANAYYHHTCNINSFTRKNIKKRCIDRISFHKQIEILLGKYNRSDLLKHNFFPLNDKYEFFFSFLFSKNEYQALYSPKITFYYLRRHGYRKYTVLYLAETIFYSVLKKIIILIRPVKHKIKVFFTKTTINNL
jgi:glycosyltransferase involved in cell wall biosynthesis